MAVSTSSPLHQQTCVAATTAIGAAFGALAGMGAASAPGAVGGAAVGLLIGVGVCDHPSMDRLFKDHLDFESKLKDFEADAGRRSEAVKRLAAHPLVQESATAEVLLNHALMTASANPSAYYASVNEQLRNQRNGAAIAGLAPLANLARSAIRNG